MAKSVSDSWNRICNWLKTKSTEEFELILPPASEDEINAVLTQIEVDIPNDLIQLYRVMNVEDGPSIFPYTHPKASYGLAYSPLSLEQVLRDWQMQLRALKEGGFEQLPQDSDPEVRNQWWNIAWIPFAWDGACNWYCIDMDPAKTGTRGQVITHSHEDGAHHVLAPSLADYLSDLADGLEAGQYQFDNYGVQPKS
jgi:cell wall assembly regulator SMI1